MDRLEHRSRVRITWRFWVAVEGIDDYPRLRSGNISASGIYFETDRSIGDPGSVQWLHLAATEQEQPMEVMARVLRLTADTPGHGEGVALEFMPEDEATRQALLHLVREVATIRMQEEEGTGLGLTTATDRAPGVQRLTLETTLDLAVGQVMRLTIQTDESGESVMLRGRVGQVLPMTKLGDDTISRVTVQVIDAPPPRSAREIHAQPSHETTTIDLQFNELVATVPDEVEEEDRSSSGDLMGHLSRVRLPSLLSFLERSKLSGELQLETKAGRTASIFIDCGRMLDVESAPPFATARAALAKVVKWNDGSFHFVAGEIGREDRLQLSSGLLSPKGK